MSDQHVNSDSLDLARRMRSVLNGANMDGHCLEMLRSAFDRFLELETRRMSKRLLIGVRDQKQRIAALLGLLSDLDQITETEPDHTVYVEMALLFEEIGRTATNAAASLREVDVVKANETPPIDGLQILTSEWAPHCATVSV
jgi:hypothetical protein